MLALCNLQANKQRSKTKQRIVSLLPTCFQCTKSIVSVFPSVNFLIRASVPFVRFKATIPLTDLHNGMGELVNLKATEELNLNDLVRDKTLILLTSSLCCGDENEIKKDIFFFNAMV